MRRDTMMDSFLRSPIIILGFGRTGTTIISEIVFSHPSLAWPSNYQARFPQRTGINRIRRLFDNNLWRLIGQKKQLNKVRMWNRFAFKPAEAYAFWDRVTGRDFSRTFLLNESENKADREIIRARLAGLVEQQNRRRLAFKITGPPRLEYLHSLFPDSRFVWITREPLPTIRSLLRVHFYQTRQHHLWWKGEGVYSQAELEFVEDSRQHPALVAALQYYKIHEVFRRERDNLALQSQVHELSYEGFVSNPASSLSVLLDFLHLDRHPLIQDAISSNVIYDRNISGGHYISPDLDSIVHHVACNGVTKR